MRVTEVYYDDVQGKGKIVLEGDSSMFTTVKAKEFLWSQENVFLFSQDEIYELMAKLGKKKPAKRKKK